MRKEERGLHKKGNDGGEDRGTRVRRRPRRRWMERVEEDLREKEIGRR